MRAAPIRARRRGRSPLRRRHGATALGLLRKPTNDAIEALLQRHVRPPAQECGRFRGVGEITANVARARRSQRRTAMASIATEMASGRRAAWTVVHVLLPGYNVASLANELAAHGADQVTVVEHEALAQFMAEWEKTHPPNPRRKGAA